ncbi:1575_t:CDS:10, partial [Funneliformis caledonium]
NNLNLSGATKYETFNSGTYEKRGQEDNHKEQPGTKQIKIEDFFPIRAVTPSTDMNNDYTDHDGETSVPLNLTYIGGEEESTSPLSKSRIPQNVLVPFTNPYQKQVTRSIDVGWKMIGLDQSELDFFDNMEDLEVQQTLHILNAYLTILKSYLEHLKLPLNEGKLMICFERCREGQDPNNKRARTGQKTDIIIDLPTGPALEGFICEVSGGLPADYMKVVVFGCQVIGKWSYLKSLQMNLYAMNVRTPEIYRFGIVDKVSLPASAKELLTYEAVHVMLRSLEHRLGNLTDYCTDLKVKHAKLRRKHDYIYQEDRLAFSNNTPNSSPKNKLPISMVFVTSLGHFVASNNSNIERSL